MPDRNGIDTLKQLKKEKPKLAVLMLSMHPEETYALRAIRAGASGYLNKQSAPALLSRPYARWRVRRYISPAVAEALAGTSRTAPTAPRTRPCPTGIRNMRLIASGKTLTEIAAEMHLSVKTVSVYRARLLEKMHLKNNSELTHYALKKQLWIDRPSAIGESPELDAVRTLSLVLFITLFPGRMCFSSVQETGLAR